MLPLLGFRPEGGSRRAKATIRSVHTTTSPRDRARLARGR
jgi:hypothetical protein